MSIADPATHTDHEIGAETIIARQRAEIERLRLALERISSEGPEPFNKFGKIAREALTAAMGTTDG